jgi:hypothetical protein
MQRRSGQPWRVPIHATSQFFPPYDKSLAYSGFSLGGVRSPTNRYMLRCRGRPARWPIHQHEPDASRCCTNRPAPIRAIGASSVWLSSLVAKRDSAFPIVEPLDPKDT